MSDCKTNDGSTDYEFEAYDRPTNDAAIQILATACTEYELDDEIVTDTTGDLICSSVVNIDYVAVRGSMGTPSYRGDTIVAFASKTHRFSDGEGAITLTVEADRETHEITAIKVDAFLE